MVSSLPIRIRISLAFAVLLAAIIAVVGVSVVEMLRAQLLVEIDGSLQARAVRVMGDVDDSVSDTGVIDANAAQAALSDMPPGEEILAPGLYVEILDPAGTLLACTPDLPSPKFRPPSNLLADAAKGKSGFDEVTMKGGRVRLFAQPITRNARVLGVVVVGRSLHFADLAVQRSQQLIAVAAVSAVVLSLIGGWILTGRALGPIFQMTRVARRIAQTGQFEQQLPPPRVQDEVGELTATFNEMLERVGDTLQRQREFLADASHELRSPLTIVRGNLDLLGSDVPEAERDLSVQVIKGEVDRMGRLVSDLLFLAEVDAQEMILREEVRLDRLIATMYCRANEIDHDDHRMTLSQNDPIVVLGDSARLEQMLWNLVDNARRYTPPGGTITVALRSVGDLVEITIADTGIGIAPEHLPRVFERFYRVDQSRSRAKGGTGLGLAIVRQVALAHGGDVSVQSTVGKGTTFTVLLPAFPC